MRVASSPGRYAYKAIKRYRAAHEDIVNAITERDNALQKMLKTTDATILQEIADEAVHGPSRGLYRQKKQTGGVNALTGGSHMEGSCAFGNIPTDSPGQLREKFTAFLKVIHRRERT